MSLWVLRNKPVSVQIEALIPPRGPAGRSDTRGLCRVDAKVFAGDCLRVRRAAFTAARGIDAGRAARRPELAAQALCDVQLPLVPFRAGPHLGELQPGDRLDLALDLVRDPRGEVRLRLNAPPSPWVDGPLCGLRSPPVFAA